MKNEELLLKINSKRKGRRRKTCKVSNKLFHFIKLNFSLRLAGKETEMLQYLGRILGMIRKEAKDKDEF